MPAVTSGGAQNPAPADEPPTRVEQPVGGNRVAGGPEQGISRAARTRALWLTAALLCVSSALVAALLAIGIHTRSGMRMDKNLTYTVGGSGDFFHTVHAFTFWVTTPALAGLSALTFVTGLLLRRPRAALAAPAILIGTSVLTRTLKLFVGHWEMPSGHATAGLGLALAILVISPIRWRLPAIAVATFIGTGLAEAAMFAMRHAPGDVIAAILTTTSSAAAAVCFFGLLPLGHRRGPSAGPSNRTVGRTIALSSAAVLLVFVVMGASYTGHPVDLLLMWLAYGLPAAMVAASIWWMDRYVVRAFLD